MLRILGLARCVLRCVVIVLLFVGLNPSPRSRSISIAIFDRFCRTSAFVATDPMSMNAKEVAMGYDSIWKQRPKLISAAISRSFWQASRERVRQADSFGRCRRNHAAQNQWQTFNAGANGKARPLDSSRSRLQTTLGLRAAGEESAPRSSKTLGRRMRSIISFSRGWKKRSCNPRPRQIVTRSFAGRISI